VEYLLFGLFDSFLFGLALIVFLIVTLIKVWVNASQIQQLKKQIHQLQDGVAPKQKATSTTPAASITETPKPAKTRHIPSIKKPAARPASTGLNWGGKAISFSFEKELGAKLPVWIGGVALVLSGFYLVKYSIETGLVTPTIRTVLGGVFGLICLTAGDAVRQKMQTSTVPRIAQALSGAGIAILYVSSYAAAQLYGLVPIWVGFLAMAGITFLAVTLALLHGAPIALLGLIGGFMTPSLMSTGEGNIIVLFTYLYFVLTALMTIIRQKNWWWLSIPTVLATFAYVLFWLFFAYTPGDSLWLCLFLIASSTTMVITLRGVTNAGKLPNIVSYLALGGAILFIGLIAFRADFGLFEWSIFGLFAIASLALAYMDAPRYAFAPWAAMTVNAVMLFSWEPADANVWGKVC